MSDTRRTALANFLRARRARLTPQDVGMAPGLRRRTPGLRREEVALLSGVGITWYTWLEQGREINPSPEVLAAIARTLKLDGAATDYLFRMAGLSPVEAPPGPGDPPDHLLRLIHDQHPAPCMIIDEHWDLRAWNAASEAIYRYSDWPAEDRNVAWILFASQRVREATLDWERHARRAMAELRESFARHPTPRMVGLMARLRRDFPEANAWLDEREVSRLGGGVVKEIRLTSVGTLRLNQIVLRPAETPHLQLVLLQPVPGTGTTQRLADLADLSAVP